MSIVCFMSYFIIIYYLFKSPHCAAEPSERDVLFDQRLKKAFSGKLHKIEIKRAKGRTEKLVTKSKVGDEGKQAGSHTNSTRTRQRRASIAVMENANTAEDHEIIEEVRKLHEAYQFITVEHHKRKEKTKRRSSVCGYPEGMTLFKTSEMEKISEEDPNT